MSNAFEELPLERPSSLDETGRRIAIHPATVKGFWKTRRVIVQSVLLIIFLVMPWIRVNGLQSIWLDIPARKFVIFGVTFWAHDTPLLLLILATFAFSIALVTTMWGRVWCGWACPQTVFIERVFRYIENLVEGSYTQRIALDRSPWNARKIALRSLKWALFAAVSIVLTHSFLAYFVGTEQLRRMVQASPKEEWQTFLFMLSATAAILFNFGWFREQFCIVMCPYGKIQSLFTDENTFSVTYDAARGEPRRAIRKNDPAATPAGDCVNCFKCVKACPTGIDIRRGAQQLECIGCTACMDACDDVMAKTKRPVGLIRYASEVTLRKKILTPSMLHSLKRKKSVFLLLAGGFSAVVLSVSIANRRDLKISALRATDTPYQLINDSNGKAAVINHFKIDIRNQSPKDYLLRFAPRDPGRLKLVTALPEYSVKGGASERVDIFLEFSAEEIKIDTALIVSGISVDGTYEQSVDLHLLGPSLGR